MFYFAKSSLGRPLFLSMHGKKFQNFSCCADAYTYHICRAWYNGSYTMATKPIKFLELHYTMTRFLIIKPRSRRLGGFLLCTRFIFFFFRHVGEQTQTPTHGQLSSPDDVIISQLQAISQLFSSYPPSGEFCQVGEY